MTTTSTTSITSADTIPLAYATSLGPAPIAVTTPLESSSGVKGIAILSLPTQKSKRIEEPEIKQLKEQGFTAGLAKALTANNDAFPLRIWVVDNSGSMTKADGHRIVPTAKSSDVRFVSCTRWTEIQETVEYHAQMAALLEAPTVFRLLNSPGAGVGPQQFSIAERGPWMIPEDLEKARRIMRSASPAGVTPLSQHIREIRDSIRTMAPTLLGDGKKVAIILATDGLPTDYRGAGGEYQKKEFVEALRLLEGLPVWVVIRLCTDEEDVVSFYNDLDSQLELSLEVLDDFVEEAREVYQYNKWLNYTLPLHRCREMGYHNRLFDLLDERALTKDEIRDFCFLLFGDAAFDGVPDPNVNWKGFLKALSEMLKHEQKQWNPIKGKVKPLIDVKKLDKEYGSCSIM